MERISTVEWCGDSPLRAVAHPELFSLEKQLWESQPAINIHLLLIQYIFGLNDLAVRFVFAKIFANLKFEYLRENEFFRKTFKPVN